MRGGRAAGIADITVQESGSAPQPLRDQQTYRVIMNEYIARGGDGYSVFARAQGARYNTGCIDAEVFQDYARSLGTLRRPAEQRITFINESK
jgi:5'-nucleotidase